METLNTALTRLEQIDGKEFPETDLNGVHAGIGGVQNELREATNLLVSAVGQIDARINAQDRAIRSMRNAAGKARTFEFEFVREDFSDLLKKVVATEIT